MSSQASAGTMSLPPDRSAASLGPSPGPADAPAAPRRTYAAQALSDTFRHTGARIGLTWVAVLFVCGIFAPFLANTHPLLLKTNDQWSSPLLRHLTQADVLFLVGTGFAIALACARKVPGGRRTGLFAFAVLALVTATAAPWTIGKAGRAFGWIVQSDGSRYADSPTVAVASVLLLVACLASLGVWPFLLRGHRWLTLSIVVPAVLIAGLLAYRPVRPPTVVVFERYRQMERDGQVQYVLRAPVPYSPTDYLRDAPELRRTPPSGRHWFGVEEFGADILSRMIHASRIALTIGFISTGIAVVIGVVIGGLMGYFVGIADIIGMRLIEIFEAIPTLFLLITIVAVTQSRNIYLMMVIIGLTGWTGDARFIRAEFLRLRKQDFVQAAIAAGLPLRSVIFRHMLPNGIAPVLVAASFGIASAILTESILSFLGLGLVQEPSWGGMLNQARAAGGNFSWWIAVFPGTAIFLTVFAYNLIGEALRDALDPKLRTLE